MRRPSELGYLQVKHACASREHRGRLRRGSLLWPVVLETSWRVPFQNMVSENNQKKSSQLIQCPQEMYASRVKPVGIDGTESFDGQMLRRESKERRSSSQGKTDSSMIFRKVIFLKVPSFVEVHVPGAKQSVKYVSTNDLSPKWSVLVYPFCPK